MLDSITVGKVIQRFREEKGLSQEVLSGFADIGRTHLNAIERGARKPTLETSFYRISEAMNIKPSILLRAIEEDVEKKPKVELRQYEFCPLHLCYTQINTPKEQSNAEIIGSKEKVIVDKGLLLERTDEKHSVQMSEIIKYLNQNGGSRAEALEVILNF